MSRQELIEKLITAAKEWREADVQEPIGSQIPFEKLKVLAFAVDDLKHFDKKD